MSSTVCALYNTAQGVTASTASSLVRGFIIEDFCLQSATQERVHTQQALPRRALTVHCVRAAERPARGPGA